MDMFICGYFNCNSETLIWKTSRKFKLQASDVQKLFIFQMDNKKNYPENERKTLRISLKNLDIAESTFKESKFVNIYIYDCGKVESLCFDNSDYLINLGIGRIVPIGSRLNNNSKKVENLNNRLKQIECHECPKLKNIVTSIKVKILKDLEFIEKQRSLFEGSGNAKLLNEKVLSKWREVKSHTDGNSSKIYKQAQSKLKEMRDKGILKNYTRACSHKEMKSSKISDIIVK